MAMAQKHPITISLGPEGYVWKDEDVIDVLLTPLPNNVTRIYVPGQPDDVGYTSSGCTVSGSVNGSAITGGYGGIDRMYCLPGMSCQVSKIANLEHYWFVWASLMDDGTWETGNAMLGSGNYATATYHAQGQTPAIATNEAVGAKVVWEERDGVNQPVRATLDFGGHTFDFEATHNSAAAAVSLGIAWMHGTVQKKDGPRAGEELVDHGGHQDPRHPPRLRLSRRGRSRRSRRRGRAGAASRRRAAWRSSRSAAAAACPRWRRWSGT